MLSLSPHPQDVLDEADGDVGEVEAVEDVVVLHDGFQVVEADEVDELVDAGQVVVGDGLRVAVEQEAVSKMSRALVRLTRASILSEASFSRR